MRILMISLDKTLLGADYSGDVLERHKEYSQFVDKLDIIVFSKKGFSTRKISDKLFIHPTNSLSKLFYVRDACRIAIIIISRELENTFQLRKNPQRGFLLRRSARSLAPTSLRDVGDSNHARSRFYASEKHFPILKNMFLVVTQTPFLSGLVGWKIKRKFNIPLLIHFHGDFWQNRYWLREKWYNFGLLLLSKFLVRRADGVRVVSSGIKEKLIRQGIDKNKIRIIPTPVDVERFEKYDQQAVKKFNQAHEYRKTIINVGRYDSSKDYQTLFRAINLVKERYDKIAFWQVGANIRLSGRIKFDDKTILTSTGKIEGKIEQNRLSDYYHASDIYVSSSKHESFGKVLIEAMAAGLPVVATATTGSKEIVQNEVNGFLVPIGNSKALAEKILYLLNNPDIAKQMGEKGRQMVKQRFNREITIKKIIDFWEDIIKR